MYSLPLSEPSGIEKLVSNRKNIESTSNTANTNTLNMNSTSIQHRLQLGETSEHTHSHEHTHHPERTLPPPNKRYRINDISTRLAGGKYFVTVSVSPTVQFRASRIMCVFIDSGADISIIPKYLVVGWPCFPLDKPREVAGVFDGETRAVKLTHYVNLEFNFKPGKFRTAFFIADCAYPIIGTDLLRDKSLGLDLMTGRELFKVKNVAIRTKSTVELSKEEYERRKRMDVAHYEREMMPELFRPFQMRVKERRVIPPHSTVHVNMLVDAPSPHSDPVSTISDYHSFISYFDRDQNGQEPNEGLFIPSVTFEAYSELLHRLPVINNSAEEFILCPGFIAGEVVEHPSTSDFDEKDYYREENTPTRPSEDWEPFEVWPLFDVIQQLREREERVNSSVNANDPKLNPNPNDDPKLNPNPNDDPKTTKNGNSRRRQ